MRLAIHHPFQQMVIFREGEEQKVVQAEKKTTLTAWFDLNLRDPSARRNLYHDIPEHYVYERNGGWRKCKKITPVIGRMYQVQPSHPERFALRLLLLHVPGATSFEDLRSVDRVLHPTFKEAAKAMGLLEDDLEWQRCMENAILTRMPQQIRQLFVTLLLFCQPTNELQLYLNCEQSMAEDFIHDDRVRLQDPNHPYSDRHKYLCLQAVLGDLLSRERRSDFNLPSHTEEFHDGVEHPQRDIIDEVHERHLGEQLMQQLNETQSQVAHTIINAVNAGSDIRCFYIDGAGGTGKTFLYNTLVHIFRGMGHKVTCVASSRIASTLLIDGTTSHSRFKIPIPLLRNSTCNISRRTKESEFLQETSVFIWDEASMIPANALNAVDRLLQDLCGNSYPFGNKFFILGGDFRQILPVVRHGSRASIIQSCVKSSPLWQHFQQF